MFILTKGRYLAFKKVTHTLEPFFSSSVNTFVIFDFRVSCFLEFHIRIKKIKRQKIKSNYLLKHFARQSTIPN